MTRVVRSLLVTARACCTLVLLAACDSSSVYLGSDQHDGGDKPLDAGKTRRDSGVCPEGFGDCDGDDDNGCEADLALDREHCGACNQSCSAGDCSCEDGEPVARCVGGRADCNGDAKDGCEVDLSSDSNHCGSCDMVCPTRGFDVFGATCINSRCILRCEPGMADCDADPRTGCEVFVMFDKRNCGACGVACDNCRNGRCMDE